MIKSITVTNHLGDELTLELERPEKSGFLVKSITGLGPVNANINTTELSTDGSIFNSARISSRNIVMDLAFLWNPTIEEMRLKSYKYFPVKKPIVFKIETDSRVCEIVGYIESNEPAIFSSQCGCQVSIICPEPYFQSVEINTTVFYGVEPTFEFPFESTEDGEIETGNIKNKSEEVVTYYGDADIGVSILIHVTNSPGNINIYNTQTREQMHINDAKITTMTGSALKTGDDIIITTSTGNKRISLRREGVLINILNCIDKNSDWFTLSMGDNIFVYTAAEGNERLQFTVENKIMYEGV